MGRSSACLRIILCARNPDDGNSSDNDLRVSKVKSSKDKSGWSFRKKSVRPSNTVITERATYGHKESPDESAIFSSQFTGGSNDSGKASLTQCRNEKAQPVVSERPIVSEHASNAENGEKFAAKSDEYVQESAVVIVQASIRGFLAQRKLFKLKDVLKAQPEVQRNTVELNSVVDPQVKEISEKLNIFPGVPLNFSSETTEVKLENGIWVPSESEENLITYEGEKINFHTYRITDSVADDDAEQASLEVHSLLNNPKANHLDEERKISEQLRNDRSKFSFGSDSRDASATTLIFGESNFEFAHHSSGVYKMDDVVSKFSSVKEEKIPKYAGSECGTELSISSTLDSPDRSEAGVTLDGLRKEVQDKGTENYGNVGTLDAKDADTSTNLPNSLTEKQSEKLDNADGDSDGSVVSIDVSQIEQKLKLNTYDAERKLSFQEKPPSQEASSMCQELLLQTPSSQLSTKLPRDKPDEHSPKRSRKCVPYDKKSPLKPNIDQPPRDQGSGKKRDSFGSDQECRNSTSSNSLPRFMQATESARAKLQANSGSPKSSPDLEEGDIHVKKRHSLPIANVKEVSPRIQQSRKERKKWQR